MKLTKTESEKYWKKFHENQSRRKVIAEINERVWKEKSYDDYYVGKYDKNNNLIAVFSNRNQAVREFFPEANDYMRWNGSLQQRMLRGGNWRGFSYRYIDKQHYDITVPVQNTLRLSPVIVVDIRGEEKEFEKMIDCSIMHDIDYSQLYTYLLDSGKLYKNRLAFYRKGIMKEFKSKHEAITFYRIGKDKFKKLYYNNLPIRGQRVIIKSV